MYVRWRDAEETKIEAKDVRERKAERVFGFPRFIKVYLFAREVRASFE